MATDPLAKVSPGQALKIPAAAYNAFVDAAKATRGVQQHAGRDTQREQTQALTPIKNTSATTIPRFGILGINGPLFQPSDALESFKRRAAFTGGVPSDVAHMGKFVIALEPIAPGALGMACAGGLCAVQVDIPTDGRERRYADIATGSTANLKASDRGAATILWHEPGTGIKWAIVRLGGFAESRVFPVALSLVGGSQGSALIKASWTYDVADAITDEQLAMAVNPTAAPHTWRRPFVGPVSPATFGSAHVDIDGALVLDWINEMPSPMWVFPITLVQTGGLDGSPALPATWTYAVSDATSGITLGTNIDPVAPLHQWKRPPTGKMIPATHGYASLTGGGFLVIGWINELPELGALAVFPVSLVLAEFDPGSDISPTRHQYNIFDVATGAQINPVGFFVNPDVAPHQWKRPTIGRYAPATFGLAYRDASDTVIITWINEVPELEACAAAAVP